MDQVTVAWCEAVERKLALQGIIAGFLLVACDLGRVWHQTYAFFGGFEPITLEAIRTITNETLWGSGWKLQVIAATFAVIAFVAAYWSCPAAWLFTWLLVIIATISRPLTGHAVEQGSWLSLPAILQAVHVMGAATWIGTLGTVVFVGLRHVACLDPRNRVRVVAVVVNAFSPVALTAATALFIAGTATSFMYLGSPGAIIGTTYGRVLLAKLLGFMAVVAVGFFNWQRVRPSLDPLVDVGMSHGSDTSVAEALLWRSACFEVALAAIVLVITAVLVTLPMPMG